MKVGDLVKWQGATATVIRVYRRRELSGNPDGDFDIILSYDVLCGDKIIRTRRRLPVISSS